MASLLSFRANLQYTSQCYIHALRVILELTGRFSYQVKLVWRVLKQEGGSHFDSVVQSQTHTHRVLYYQLSMSPTDREIEKNCMYYTMKLKIRCAK